MGLFNDNGCDEGRKILPRAYHKGNIPMTLLNNLRMLLVEYPQLPLNNLSIFYVHKFGEVPEFNSFKGGLAGLLKTLNDMILVERIDGYRYLSLIDKTSTTLPEIDNLRSQHYSVDSLPELLKQRKLRSKIGYLFDPSFFLWKNRTALLNVNKKLKIEPSALEIAFMLHQQKVTKQIQLIQQVLQRFPDGLLVSQLIRYARIDIRVFGVSPPDIDCLTQELPELFFREKRRVGEDIIYDGSTRTIKLDGNYDNLLVGFNARSFVAQSIDLGIYQRTLLLIREAGLNGLKMNVWTCSMRANWPELDGPQDIIDKFSMNRYNFLLSLAKYHLIEIKPGKEYKNDLRLHLPNVKLDQSKLKNLGLIGFDETDNGTSYDTHNVYAVED